MADNPQEGAGNEEQAGAIFPFFDLPIEMRRSIIDQVDAPTFAVLLRTDRQMKQMLNEGSWFFYRKVASLHQYTNYFDVCLNGPDDHVLFGDVNSRHWKLHGDRLVVENPLGELGLIALIYFVRMHKIHADTIEMASNFLVTGENMASLCELLGAKKWSSMVSASKEVLLPVGQIVEQMFVVETDCDNGTLLGMTNVKYFTMFAADNVTDAGINLLIKQWLRGERHKFAGFVFDRRAINVDALLEGLPLNVVWTEEAHEHTMLGKLPLDLIQERMQTAGMERIYSLWSYRDVTDFRILRVGQSQIGFSEEESEASLLSRIEEQL